MLGCANGTTEVAHMWMNLGKDYSDIYWGTDTVWWGPLKKQGENSAWKQHRPLEVTSDSLEWISLRSDHEDHGLDNGRFWNVMRAVRKLQSMCWAWQSVWIISARLWVVLTLRSWFQHFVRNSLTWDYLGSRGCVQCPAIGWKILCRSRVLWKLSLKGKW